MKARLGRRQRNAALAFAAILLVSILTPLTVSDRIDQLLTDLSGSNEDVETALEHAAVQRALEALDPARPALDAVLAAYEQQVGTVPDDATLPSPFFIDSRFDMGPRFPNGEGALRLGGWGSWTTQGTGWSADWVDPLVESARPIGFWDGLNDTHRYPVGPEPLDAYLVSPRISLRSLPNPLAGIDSPLPVEETGVDGVVADVGVADGATGFDVDGHRVQVEDDAAAQADRSRQAIEDAVEDEAGEATADVVRDPRLATGGDDPHRILLQLWHAYNFADGLDGGRVELFTTAPTEGDLGRGGRLLEPLSGYTGTAAFDDEDAFSGSNGAGRQDTFDLSEFAGQDVWIVFHAATQPVTFPNAYFSDPHLFDLGRPMGWDISQAKVTGPAFVHNLRIDEILEPGFTDGNGEHKVPAGQALQASMLLINHGAGKETVTPTVEVRDHETQQVLETCTAPPRQLRVGDAKRATMTCALKPAEGQRLDLTFLAPVGGDSHPEDNRATATAYAVTAPLSHLAGLISLRPSLGDEATPRELLVPITNPGFTAVTLTLTLQVTRTLGGTTVPLGPDDYGHTSLVDGSSSLTQSVLVPADPAGIRNHVTAGWILTLPDAGASYGARVTAPALRLSGDSQARVDQTLSATTRLATAAPYFTDFDGTVSNAIVQGSPAWTTRSLVDAPPPQCLTPSEDSLPGFACPTRLWQFNGTVPAAQQMARLDPKEPLAGPGDEAERVFAGYTHRLAARVSTQGIAPTDQFGEFRLDVQHSLQDVNCLSAEPASGSTDREAFCLADPPLVTGAALSIERVPAPGPGGQAGAAVDRALQLAVPWNLASVNRAMYLDGQWIRESPPPLRLDLTTAQVADLQVNFDLTVRGGQGDDACPARSPVPAGMAVPCPTWRISYVRLVGVNATGAEHVLLRFDGADPEARVGQFSAVVSNPSTQPPTLVCGEAAAGVPPDAFCKPGWTLTELPVPSASTSPWAQASEMAGNPSLVGGFWTHSATDPVTGQVDYAIGDKALLVSPLLKVPTGGLDPLVQFHHLFDYHAGDLPPFNRTQTPFPDRDPLPNETLSGGTFMVRFHEPDGTYSPFMPVAVRYGATPTPLSGAHRFSGSDCEFYYYQEDPVERARDPNLRPDLQSCTDVRLGERSAATQAYHLNDLPYLDYRRVDGTDPLQLADPDTIALAPPGTRDLRGQVVQFAFRADTVDRKPEQLCAPTPLCARGWFIHDFAVTEERRFPFDLKVLGASVLADYDWASLGIGPGTHLELDVQVENSGLFALRAATVAVEFARSNALPGEPVVSLPVYTPILSLRQGERTWLRVPVDVPEGLISGQSYAMRVTVRLPQAEPDQQVDDNCVLLQQPDPATFAVAQTTCELHAGPAVLIRRVQDLRIGMEVTPLADRENGPRTVSITVRNEGNIVVRDAILTFRYQDVEALDCAGSIDCCPAAVCTLYRWRVPESPPPGEAREWSETDPTLRMPVMALTPKTPDGPLPSFALPKGRYLMVATIVGGSGASGFDDLVYSLADSFDTFYSDEFGANGVVQVAPGMVSGTLHGDDGWARDPKGNFLDDLSDTVNGAPGAWRFGDPASFVYEDEADASLWLPEVDLSSAKRAILTVAHNESLEPGFDGFRLEASLDDGDSWLAVEPKGGYSGALQADNPLNEADPARRDPTVQVEAFTGSSGRWKNSEFDLGSIPGLTQPFQLHSLGQAGFGQYDAGSRQVGASTGRADWCDRGHSWTEGGLNLQCWQRDNLQYDQPRADPEGASGDGHFLWIEPNPGTAPRRSATVFLDLPAFDCRTLEPGQEWRVSFWVWREARTPLMDPFGLFPSGYQPVFDAQDASKFPGGVAHKFVPQKLYLSIGDGDAHEPWETGLPFSSPGRSSSSIKVLEEDPSGWTKVEVPLARPGSDCPTFLGFQRTSGKLSPVVQSEEAMGDAADRGVALDDVRTQVVATDVATGIETVMAGAGTQAYPVFPFVGSAWTCPVSAPAVGGDRCPSRPSGAGEAGPGWRVVERIPPVADAWNIVELDPTAGPEDAKVKGTDHDEKPATVWLFGSKEAQTYPNNTRERLLTPFRSLRDVGGVHASLTYWERYDLPAGIEASNQPKSVGRDTRSIYVQAMEPQLDGGEAPGPWILLRSVRANGPLDSETVPDEHCTRKDLGHGWCYVSIPLDGLGVIGKRVRFAFQMESRGVVPSTAHFADSDLGHHWMIDDIGIMADTLVAGPVQLRLRMGTDASIRDGFAAIDNVRLVGFRYEDNAAVVPESLQTLRGAPGHTVQLRGVVRNLGQELVSGVALQVDATPLMGQSALSIGFDSRGTAIDGPDQSGASALSSTMVLGPPRDGATTDRRPFVLNFTLPSCGSCVGSYEVKLSLRSLTSQGDRPWDDDNLGDNQQSIVLAMDGEDRLEVVEPSVQPRTVLASTATGAYPPVKFQAIVQNEGTRPLEGVGVKFLLARIGPDGTPDVTGPQQVATGLLAGPLHPGSGERVEGTWQPTGALVQGCDVALCFFRVQMVVGTRSFDGELGHVLVGRRPIYWSDDLSSLPGDWQVAEAANGGCGPTNPLLAPGSTDPRWHPSPEASVPGASQSWMVGSLELAQSYPANRSEALATPPIDLRFLRDLAEDPTNAFAPNLNLRYRSLLGPNDGVVLGAVVPDGDGAYPLADTMVLDSDDYASEGTCPNPLARPGVPVAMLGGADPEPSRWHTASAPFVSALGGQVGLVGASPKAVVHFGSGDDVGAGFALGAIGVSAYKAQVLPGRQEIGLATGANKTFYLKVANTGAAADDYVLRIDPALTGCSFRAGVLRSACGTADEPRDGAIPVTILDPVLHLEAGESTIASLRIEVPERANVAVSPSEQVVVQVASLADPNWATEARIHVRSWNPTLLPRLETSIVRAVGQPDSAFELDVVRLVVGLRNTGRAASPPTDVVVFACPAGTSSGETLDVCDEPIEVGTVKVPRLDPNCAAARKCFSDSVVWELPPGLDGTFSVFAVADPLQRIRQYEPPATTAVLKPDLAVLRRATPDLSVESLTVRVAGQDVDEVFEGDIVEISGLVRNTGTQVAADVEVSLHAQQTTLRRERRASLAPDEAIELTARWSAVAGTQLVSLQAFSLTALDDPLADNARTVSLVVLAGDVSIALVPPKLDLRPGGEAQVTLGLRNDRDSSIAVDALVQRPDGIMVQGAPTNVTLERSGRLDATLTISAAPDALPQGTHVTVVLRGSNGLVLATAELPIEIVGARSVGATGDPVFMAPGRQSTLLHLTNLGVATEVSLSAGLPDGWNLTVEGGRLALAPGDVRDVEATLDVPVSTPPGTYDVSVLLGDEVIGVFPVHVTAQAAWQSVALDVRTTDAGRETVLRVTNVGNAPGVPDLGEGVGTVDPSPLELAVGASAVYRVLEPTMETPSPGEETGDLPSADVLTGEALQIVDWDLLPVADVHAGDVITLTAVVRNLGTSPSVPVRVFAGDTLVATATIDVPPGTSSPVELSWRATGGDHVVTLSAGTGPAAVADSALVHTDPSARPTPGPGLWAALAALAFVLVLRRRRLP